MSAPALNASDEKIALLREAIEIIMWELTALNEKRWEDIHDLRLKKEVMADQLREFEWIPGPEDEKNIELMMLTAQVIDLEYQCRQKIKKEIQINRSLSAALQQKQFEWLACLQTYRMNSFQ